MPPLEIPLFDFVLPAALALAVLAFAWRRKPSETAEPAPRAAPASKPVVPASSRATGGGSSRARAAGAFALGAGVLVAWWSIFREFALPSETRVLAAKDWIPFCVVGAMVAASLALSERVRRFLPSGGTPFVLAILVVLSMHAAIRQGSTGSLHALAAFLAAMATWASLELSSERLRGPLPCLCLALACAGSAVAIALGGSLVFGRLCGTAAALCVACAVIAWRRRAFTLSGGPVAVLCVVLVGSWINAVREMPVSSVLLAWAAIVVPSVAGIGPFSTWPAVRRETARVVLVLLLAGAAIWIAFAARPPSYGY
ncbi:MAG: hypothetical protein IPJ77_17085 [Planctomycetes bacterium]|nr:hypothetical protein [Planctomycetota bacterium]